MTSSFYPFCFAVFPILAYYSTNEKELSLNAIYWPIAIILILTVVIIWITEKIAKTKDNVKIGVSLFLLCFFSYGHFSGIIKSPVIYSAVFALMIYLVLQLRQKSNIHIILMILGSYLLIYNLARIVPFEVKRRLNKDKIVLTEMSPPPIIEKSQLPDIYYLIFDRYAAFNTLSDYYHYDNQDFFKFFD